MTMYARTDQMAAYLPQVVVSTEVEALYTDLLTRASAIIDEILVGVDPALLLPPPASVEQVCLEVAVNMWRQRDRGMWAPSSGVDGEGALVYTGVLTDKQMRLLRQVRMRLGAVPV